MPEIAAIVLAAGRATRFGAAPGSTKVLAPIDGKPLVRHVTEAALASLASEVVVVTGHAAEAVALCVGGGDVRTVFNADFATGMASSLRAGLAALGPASEGAIILLADMPRVSATIIDRLIGCFDRACGPLDAVVPVCRGRQGNPVLLGRRIFPAVASLSDDQGARSLLNRPEALVLSCPIDDEAVWLDIDTPAALEAAARAG